MDFSNLTNYLENIDKAQKIRYNLSVFLGLKGEI